MAKIEPSPIETPAIADTASGLAYICEHLPDGILFLDKQWRIIYANETACKISRLSPHDLNSKSHWELYPETVGTSLESTYRDVMSFRQERTLDAFYYEPFQIWLSIRVLPAPDGGIALYYRDITSAHLAELARLDTEERLRLALSAANGVGTWNWDVPADLVYADARFANLYGVDPALAEQGVPIAEFVRNIHPDDMLAVQPAIDAVLKSGGDFISQYRIYQPDGSIRWVSVRGSCSHDANGRPLRFSGVATDITEQRTWIEALRISEERYRILTELSPQCLWTAIPQGRLDYANQRFLSYLGLESIPTDGSVFIACIDPADRERVIQTWTDGVASGNEYAFDTRLLRASDGASRWWHLSASPLRDHTGAIWQWLGTATDVHDDRIAATRLLEQYNEIDSQRRELEAIYRGSPVGNALCDPKDLRVLRINDRQAQISRIAARQAIGKSYMELMPGLTAAHHLIRKAAAGENILDRNVEGCLDNYPDEHRYWNVSYSPIFDDAGNVLAVASATIETTQQKRAEAALIQSEKLAVVGRMASSIAHEINNPLESVTNLIYISRQNVTVPEVQHLLDLADQELRRVSVITNQTLRFHKQASNPREITCVDLFTTVLSLYEGRLRNSSIVIQKRKRAERSITCFEGDIRQVLNNLVSNAIDAMPSGGRLILRSREATDWRSGRKGLILTVADTGSGMSPETRANVFKAFYTTKGINGTGLGLWIGSEIVDRHDGHLTLRSSQHPSHHGTVFNLFLPFAPHMPSVTTALIQ